MFNSKLCCKFQDLNFKSKTLNFILIMKDVLNWLIVVECIYYHSICKTPNLHFKYRRDLLKGGICLIKLNLNSNYKKEKKN